MLKNISTLGKSLSKLDQKSIKGGNEQGYCPAGHCLNYRGGCTQVATALFNDCV
ncbi:hypothetical protein [uncultured Tenacibaculum sp.]|uniref:hypothetical protein n=1 Tax=uncultured Tenacibaculum sp. TaxID=174713 RepID=UPI00262125E6|nr:hypothetical protein [uncultured Tenacibaculum sp.]